MRRAARDSSYTRLGAVPEVGSSYAISGESKVSPSGPTLRQMGAHPPGADEARVYAAGKMAGAPTQRRFGCPKPCTRREIHRSNGASYPICAPRPLPDVPAGRGLPPSELGGPTRRKWRAIGSDCLTEGEDGAGLAIAHSPTLEECHPGHAPGTRRPKAAINRPRPSLLLALARLPLGCRTLFPR